MTRKILLFIDIFSISRDWLGRQDSNLGMAVPKTAALPLGDAPKRWRLHNRHEPGWQPGFPQRQISVQGAISPLAVRNPRRYKTGLPMIFGVGV
jgi:hypothetical protein